MIRKYKCTTCKKLLDGTEENFVPSYLKRGAANSNLTSLPKCKMCANVYSANYRQSLKDKGLVRSQRTTLKMAKAVRGTIYVIGADIDDTPYKIGVTVGTDVSKRKTALQTSHWVDLKIIWKSDLLERADKIEKKIHAHFDKLRIRGEWFKLSKEDLEIIPELIKLCGDEE